MRIEDGNGFINALELQREAREREDTAKTIHAKKRAKEEYKNVTLAIRDYMRNMNKWGERDDIGDQR